MLGRLLLVALALIVVIGRLLDLPTLQGAQVGTGGSSPLRGRLPDGWR